MKRTTQILLLTILSMSAGCRYEADTDLVPEITDAKSKQEITDLLMTQVDDWNAGNREAFMNGYWKSDSLRFVSNGSVNYGWQATLDNYYRRYPSTASMGELTFSELAIRPLTADWATVFGRFTLIRSEEGGGDATGLFTLILQRQTGVWRVVQDHTSTQVNQS